VSAPSPPWPLSAPTSLEADEPMVLAMHSVQRDSCPALRRPRRPARGAGQPPCFATLLLAPHPCSAAPLLA